MEDMERLRKLFHLEVCEDPELKATFLRDVGCKEYPKAEKRMAGALFCFILVADKAVLAGIA
ncbi:uncharacterized protein BKA55DRAFT_723376 [Fusarium redolens]|uniref:Uncharacterized protein n=1 Tax=Fusarium redolens TaxID=48865 RepID=A0A9P9FWB2_FUSRE|nr:uncharacterized protein BKA55DRAFT_723376 [Fusarium redolens]KAH7202899.1 hypothetical protein BKA55DRAFT_723376 [Fusarium redolens]